jgi:hypothetical protein
VELPAGVVLQRQGEVVGQWLVVVDGTVLRLREGRPAAVLPAGSTWGESLLATGRGRGRPASPETLVTLEPTTGGGGRSSPAVRRSAPGRSRPTTTGRTSSSLSNGLPPFPVDPGRDHWLANAAGLSTTRGSCWWSRRDGGIPPSVPPFHQQTKMRPTPGPVTRAVRGP